MNKEDYFIFGNILLIIGMVLATAFIDSFFKIIGDFFVYILSYPPLQASDFLDRVSKWIGLLLFAGGIVGIIWGIGLLWKSKTH